MIPPPTRDDRTRDIEADYAWAVGLVDGGIKAYGMLPAYIRLYAEAMAANKAMQAAMEWNAKLPLDLPTEDYL